MEHVHLNSIEVAILASFRFCNGNNSGLQEDSVIIELSCRSGKCHDCENRVQEEIYRIKKAINPRSESGINKILSGYETF